MIGDQLDLVIIVRSAHAVCSASDGEAMDEDDDEEDTENFILSLAARRRVSQLANNCVASFLASETAHRSQFSLSGDKNPSTVSVALANCLLIGFG